MGRNRKITGGKTHKKGMRKHRRKSYEPESKHLQKNLRINKLLRMPIASEYQTTLQCSVSGIIPGGAFPASGFLLYIVKANDLHLPFSLGNWLTNYTLAKGGSAITTATLAPAGYGNFMQSTGRGFYTFSRVLASKLSVTCTPHVVGDNCSITLVPINSGAGSLPNSIITGASMPYSKGPIQCTPTNNIKQNTLKSYVSVANLFGVPRSSIMAEDNYKALVNADPTTVHEWYILVQTNDSATTAASIDLTATIKFYVQFEATTEAGLLDTEV